MKYFTPELLGRFRSTDEEVAARATDEWDHQEELYSQHLGSIRNQLPRSLLLLVDRVSLHDAKAGLGKSGQNFVIVATPDGASPGEAVVIVYRVKSEPILKPYPSSLPPALAPEWLYDELDMVGNGTWFNLLSGGAFRHSILLSNNRELVIEFTDAMVYQTDPGETAMIPSRVTEKAGKPLR